MEQFSDTYDRGMAFGQRNTDALLFLYEESGNIGLLPCTFALIITTNNRFVYETILPKSAAPASSRLRQGPDLYRLGDG